MKSTVIPASAFQFLQDLAANNNREWFAENKLRYQREHQAVIGFADALLTEMKAHDLISTPSGKASLYRIYADTRFSKDKAPYKTHWGFRFGRATPELRGGYYVHLEPGSSFVSGGFFNPDPGDLRRIREDISLNYEDWHRLFESPAMQKIFGSLSGEKVKTAPKGFDINQPGIEWLRHKQFILRHRFTDEQVLNTGFLQQLNEVVKSLRPFFDHMSEILTTDANGESII